MLSREFSSLEADWALSFVTSSLTVSVSHSQTHSSQHEESDYGQDKECTNPSRYCDSQCWTVVFYNCGQEPMRAEGPKERPTAVLCVQLSARYVQIRQTAKYYALADITSLRFDVRAFAHTYTCCARYGYPGDRE